MQVTNTLALDSAVSVTGSWLNSKLWGPNTSSVQVLGLEAGATIKVYQSNEGTLTTYDVSPEATADPSAVNTATISANGLTTLNLPPSAWTQFVKIPGGSPTRTTVRVVSQLIR